MPAASASCDRAGTQPRRHWPGVPRLELRREYASRRAEPALNDCPRTTTNPWAIHYTRNMRLLGWLFVGLGVLLCVTFIFLLPGLGCIAVGALLHIAASVRKTRRS
jgi:hypothetical protein